MQIPRCLAAILALLLTAWPALAQDAPQIGKAPDPDKPWIAFVIAVVLVIGVATASFMTPKRGHQD